MASSQPPPYVNGKIIEVAVFDNKVIVIMDSPPDHGPTPFENQYRLLPNNANYSAFVSTILCAMVNGLRVQITTTGPIPDESQSHMISNMNIRFS